MALIGYARVSTTDQDTASQRATLSALGCQRIFEDKAGGDVRKRPQLAVAVAHVREGDTLVVVRIDRLARSLAHLLAIVEAVTAKGGHFRSVNDPIDTSSPQGVLMMQMLGAFAEFERSLIRERTRAGIEAAVARGAKPGNPRMRSRDPIAIGELSIKHKERYLHELIDGSQRWLPVVERLRPHLPWPLVLRHIRAINPPVRSFSERTLVKACRALVRSGHADPEILERAQRLPPDDRVARLVANRLADRPDATLREIAQWLSKDLHEPTPSGGLTWSAEGVRRALAHARKLRLID